MKINIFSFKKKNRSIKPLNLKLFGNQETLNSDHSTILTKLKCKWNDDKQYWNECKTGIRYQKQGTLILINSII